MTIDFEQLNIVLEPRDVILLWLEHSYNALRLFVSDGQEFSWSTFLSLSDIFCYSTYY